MVLFLAIVLLHRIVEFEVGLQCFPIGREAFSCHHVARHSAIVTLRVSLLNAYVLVLSAIRPEHSCACSLKSFWFILSRPSSWSPAILSVICIRLSFVLFFLNVVPFLDVACLHVSVVFSVLFCIFFSRGS